MLTDNTATVETTAPVDTNADGISGDATPNNSDFLNSLPEDLRGNELFAGFEDLGGLANSFLEKSGQLSERDETIGRLNQSIPVVPESPDGYEFSTPEGFSEEDLQEFRQFAHDTGMTQDQANRAMEHSIKIQRAAEQNKLEAEANAIGTLKTEWGDNFETNAKMATDAVARFGGDELKAFLNESRLGNNPLLIKMFHKIAVAISEDSLLTGNQGRVPKERRRGIDGKPMLNFHSMEKGA